MTFCDMELSTCVLKLKIHQMNLSNKAGISLDSLIVKTDEIPSYLKYE